MAQRQQLRHLCPGVLSKCKFWTRWGVEGVRPMHDAGGIYQRWDPAQRLRARKATKAGIRRASMQHASQATGSHLTLSFELRDGMPMARRLKHARFESRRITTAFVIHENVALSGPTQRWVSREVARSRAHCGCRATTVQLRIAPYACASARALSSLPRMPWGQPGQSSEGVRAQSASRLRRNGRVVVQVFDADASAPGADDGKNVADADHAVGRDIGTRADAGHSELPPRSFQGPMNVIGLAVAERHCHGTLAAEQSQVIEIAATAECRLCCPRRCTGVMHAEAVECVVDRAAVDRGAIVQEDDMIGKRPGMLYCVKRSAPAVHLWQSCLQ